MANINASTKTTAVVNKLTGELFTIPEGAVASIKQFNFVLASPDEVNIVTGKTMPGATILSIQLGTKNTLKESIAFSKEMADLEETMLDVCGDLNKAFMAVLSASVVVYDSNNKQKLSAPLSRLKATFGIE